MPSPSPVPSGLDRIDELRYSTFEGGVTLVGPGRDASVGIEHWSPTGRSNRRPLWFDRSDRVVGPAVTDGDWIYWCRLAPDAGGSQLVRRAWSGDAEHVIGRTAGLMQISDLSPCGRFVTTTSVRGFRHRATDLWSVAGTIGRCRLYPHDPGASTSSAFAGVDGSSVFVLSNADADQSSLRAIEIGSNGPTQRWCHAVADADLEAVAASPDRSWLVLVWIRDAQPWVERVRLGATPRSEGLEPAPGVEVWSVAIDDGGRLAAVVADGVGRGRLLLPDADGEPPGPATDRPASVRFASEDGLSIQGWLHRRATADQPVVFVHGGPAVYESAERQPLHRHLVDRGCAVLAPNYRGSAGFGRRFAEAGAGDRLLAPVDDILAAARVVSEATHSAEPALVAHSYGCFLALWALIDQPDRFTRAVLLAGVYDLEQYAAKTGEAWRRAMHLDDLDRSKARHRDMAPVDLASRVRADVLLIHGDQDDNVPYEQSVWLLERLPRCRLITVHGAGHDLLGGDRTGTELMTAIGDHVRHGDTERVDP